MVLRGVGYVEGSPSPGSPCLENFDLEMVCFSAQTQPKQKLEK